VAIDKDAPKEGIDTVTLTLPRKSNPRVFARLKADF
jgi:hypothetical protein